jgi:2-C-methyl-D-erythritol 2,4-cyclodiphosphate synthase
MTRTPAGGTNDPGFRIGLGYDSHRLAAAGDGGRPMVIGGVAFASPVGPVAHSDGDALMHAVVDAVLGAAGLPDIGELFPDRDPAWDGARSEVFLTEAVRLSREAGWEVGNVDATVIVQAPKLGPRKHEVRANLARVLKIDAGRVNVKGKTHERTDPSRPDGLIEAMAAVLLVRTAGA